MIWKPDIQTGPDGKERILCSWRRKFVRLTPEEQVRQYFLHRLVEEAGYPKELIAVEMTLQGTRADAVVFSQGMSPLMIVEFKAATVPLTQRTLDQAAVYNRRLQVPWLVLHNGNETVIARCNGKDIQFFNYIPSYGDLSRTE